MGTVGMLRAAYEGEFLSYQDSFEVKWQAY